MLNGLPWFVAADVLRGLGLNREAAAACRVLDADEVRVLSTSQIGGQNWGKAATITLISESGLYKLIMRANHKANPAVARFQNWVTRDILLCCAWGNKDRTIINLSQPSGCWEEVNNDVMLVELLPSGTEIKLTVEV